MASCGGAKLFFCLLFITCCCTVTVAQIALDCCLSVSNKPVDKRVAVDYRRQVRGQGCAIDATILLTRGGRKLCVTADEPWIQPVMKHVDALRKHCKKRNYKGHHCDGVRRE